MDWTLAVDFGTTFTAAAARDADGSVSLLELDGSARIPSVVALDDDGELVVGLASGDEAGWDPERVERNPKRSLGRTRHLVLGGRPVPVTDAVGALLRAVADEGARRHRGVAPSALVLTHPVRWSEARCAELVMAATAVGLPEPLLVPEPVAAALHHATRGDADQVPVGAVVAVYDLGGGTFDTAVLRRIGNGYDVVGEPGGNPDLGGERLDDLLFGLVGARLSQVAPDGWAAITSGATATARREAAQLRRDVRRAKEALSRLQTHTVHAAGQNVRLTRAEFEALVTAPLRDTVDELAATVERAGLAPSDLAVVHLAGGASRIPLVTRLMSERFGDLPTSTDDPKAVVALGAARALHGATARAPEPEPTRPDPAPVPPPPAPTVTPPAARSRRRHLLWALPVAAAVTAAALAGGVTVLLTPEPTATETVVPSAATPSVPAAAPAPTTTAAPPPTTRAPATRAPRTTAPSTTAVPTTQQCTHHCPTTEEYAEPTYDPDAYGDTYGGGQYPADSNVDPWTGGPLNYYGGDSGGS